MHGYTRFCYFHMIIELLWERCEIKCDRTAGVNIKVGLFQIELFWGMREKWDQPDCISRDGSNSQTVLIAISAAWRRA